jgi:hypothetical protein
MDDENRCFDRTAACGSSTERSKSAWRAQVMSKLKHSESEIPPAKARSRLVTYQGASSRANARDLRKISPVGRNDNPFSFAAFASLREIFRDLVAAPAALCMKPHHRIGNALLLNKR